MLLPCGEAYPCLQAPEPPFRIAFLVYASRHPSRCVASDKNTNNLLLSRLARCESRVKLLALGTRPPALLRIDLINTPDMTWKRFVGELLMEGHTAHPEPIWGPDNDRLQA
ncbi:hypothetical protein DFP72DRAFT_848627 [Ephemerocybe angulata]|uniref:Uncharacterized protein n=1 Tax=Ephemerocybe angulata TaxID=980116 RepID=A0A8H6HYD0_9AGAR|nr:hypothetical protein DFP72DRAFT_848627 [Tulosesus angulatus]